MSQNKISAPIASAGTVITAAQRADFAARVRQNTKSASNTRQAWDILSIMPRDRAVALTADLWGRCEPSRRRREQAFCHYLIVFALLNACMLLCFLVLIVTHFSGKATTWFLSLPILVQTGALGISLMRDRIVTPEQSGCVFLLSALKEARLTPAMVDALGGRWFNGSSDYRTALRQELAIMLPAYARSDSPPLDAYQQNVLRREIKQYTRRLRKPVASVPHLEAEFIVAAVRYLTGLQEGDTACKKNRVVIEQAAALPAAEMEMPTRCTVREAATACLPLVQTVRH